MADEPDGASETDNLDVIRALLQKLEEAASCEGATALPASPVTSARQGDPTGITTGSVPLEQGPAPIRTAATAASPQRSYGSIVAGLSFVLGAATAAAVALNIGPLSEMISGTARSTSDVAAARAPAEPTVVASLPTGTKRSATPFAPTSPAGAPAVVTPVALDPALDPSMAVRTGTLESIAQTAASGPDKVATRLAIAPYLEGATGIAVAFPLDLVPQPPEGDTRLVVLRGVPEWITLSKGSALGNEIWLIPAHAAHDLLFYVGEGSDDTATIKVELAMLDGRVVARTETVIRALRAPKLDATPMAAIPEAPTVVGDALVQLLVRADLALDTGDLAGARQLYKAAAEAGSAGGALKLGATYDPVQLQRLGMTMSSADEAVARRWYEIAHALGSLQAADRLTALGQR